MLVVISDLHLTDCSTASNPHETAFKLLVDELKGNVDAKAPTEIHVLLLGDIFDLVRTSWWHENVPNSKQRPWDGTLDPATAMNTNTAAIEKQFAEVLERVLAQPSSTEFVKGLKSLTETRLDTRITYVVGNHDRVLNNFESLRTRVARAFAPVPVTFANEFHDPQYAISARHGHEWDPHCHGWEFLTKVLDRKSKAGRFDPRVYQVMAIGEVITAELMGGFVWHVDQNLPAPADEPYRRLIREVNNLRPMSDAIGWISWVAQAQTPRYLKATSQAFRSALRATLNTSLAKQWDHVKTDLIFSGDITDYLSKALTVLNQPNGMKKLQALVPLFQKFEAALAIFRGHGEDGLYKGAASQFEDGALPAGTQYLVYGHTHQARQDFFKANLDGTVQMYVNTGTFLPLIQQTADRRSYARSNRMTFLCFYRADEDTAGREGNGPTMDVWDGLKRKDYLPQSPAAPQAAAAAPGGSA
jgi:UDP-2,3-diacylglucosamine pyrophosphatase LpxH